jgi:UDP-glucuronate 4-epimerase
MRVLITGAAGFIGAHLMGELQRDSSFQVLGLDNYSKFYSRQLKEIRVRTLSDVTKSNVIEVDIGDEVKVSRVFQSFQPEIVIHLAAQAGVRLRQEHFDKYVSSNLTGFCNVIGAASRIGATDFIYASSSSVYGDECSLPLSEGEVSLAPASFYGATKLSNEVVAATYSRRYGLRTRGLRLFTVYGPWGRPDMAYFRIISALQGRYEFQLSGDGSVQRDFTFIDDVTGMIRKLSLDLKRHKPGFADVVNLGGGAPYSILEVIGSLETMLNLSLQISHHPREASDVEITRADSVYRESLIGKRDFVPLNEGLARVLHWSQQFTSTNHLKSWVDSSMSWAL